MVDETRAPKTRSGVPALPVPKRAVSTRGFVRARAGGALAGATVCVVKPSGDPGTSEQCVDTDTSGRFAFAEGLEDARSLLASALGYQSRLQSLGQDVVLEEDVVIELDPGGEHLSGQVVDASGGPVMGAVVTLRGHSDVVVGAAVAGSDGRFEITESPSAIEVCAHAEAYSRTCKEVAGPSNEHVLVLAPESRIMGQVLTRTSGRAVVGASVIASNRKGLSSPASPKTSASILVHHKSRTALRQIRRYFSSLPQTDGRRAG